MNKSKVIRLHFVKPISNNYNTKLTPIVNLSSWITAFFLKMDQLYFVLRT